MKDLCQKYGFGMKIYSEKLIIWNYKEYKNRSSVLSITPDMVAKWNIKYFPSIFPKSLISTQLVATSDRLGDIVMFIVISFLFASSIIYEANKENIEETAKKRGLNTSKSGYWIFPGHFWFIRFIPKTSHYYSSTTIIR